MLSTISLALIVFGGLLAAIDAVIGSDRLNKAELFVRRTAFYLGVGDVWHSAPVNWIWAVIASPPRIVGRLLHRSKGPSLHRFPLENRRAFQERIRKLDPMKPFVLIDFGSAPEDWDREELEVCTYAHLYPNPADDFSYSIGSVAPGQPDKRVEAIVMLGGGVAGLRFADHPSEAAERHAIAYVYIEAAFEHPWRPHVYLPLPRNPLFTVLADGSIRRVFDLLQRAGFYDAGNADKRTLPQEAVAQNQHESAQGTRRGMGPGYVLVVQAIALSLWLLGTVFGFMTATVERLWRTFGDLWYFASAVLFNVIAVGVALPSFLLLWLALAPFRLAYSVSRRLGLQSYVRLAGVAMAFFGGLLQIFLSFR